MIDTSATATIKIVVIKIVIVTAMGAAIEAEGGIGTVTLTGVALSSFVKQL